MAAWRGREESEEVPLPRLLSKISSWSKSAIDKKFDLLRERNARAPLFATNFHKTFLAMLQLVADALHFARHIP